MKNRVKGTFLPRCIIFLLGKYDDNHNMIQLNSNNVIISPYLLQKAQDFKKYTYDIVGTLEKKQLKMMQQLESISNELKALNKDYYKLLMDGQMNLSLYQCKERKRIYGIRIQQELLNRREKLNVSFNAILNQINRTNQETYLNIESQKAKVNAMIFVYLKSYIKNHDTYDTPFLKDEGINIYYQHVEYIENLVKKNIEIGGLQGESSQN